MEGGKHGEGVRESSYEDGIWSQEGRGNTAVEKTS